MSNVCGVRKKAFTVAAGGVAAIELKDYSITADGATNSAAIPGMSARQESLILVLEVSNYTDGSYIAKLQHRPHDGVDWIDVTGIATASVGAAGYAIEYVDVDVFECVRIVITASSVTTGADITTYLMASQKAV